MRFKSVIGAFFFITVASIIAFIIFIQTRSFGNLITRVISDISEKKANVHVGIKSIGISLFPPGVEFHKVSIKKDFSPESKLDAEVGKLGFYISLIEFEERKLTFGEIRIEDSVIDVTYPKKDDEPEIEEIDPEIINKIFDISEKAPVGVNLLLVENSKIIINHDFLDAKRLKVFKKGKSFMTRFHLSNLNPIEDSEMMVDEIWGDVEIGKKDLIIHRLRVQHDVHTLLVKGKINNYPKLKKSVVDVKGDSTLYLKGLKEIVPLPDMIDLQSGSIQLSFNLHMLDERIEGTFKSSLKDVRSNIIYADSIDLTAEFKENKILLNALELLFEDQRLVINRPVVVADITSKKVLQESIHATTQNVSLNNALRILGQSLKPLKGELTGDMEFRYKNGDMFFSPKNNFVIKNLGLVVNEQKPFTILMIKKAVLSNANFSVVNNEFKMNSIVDLANSKLNVSGFVNSKRVNFTAPNSKIDFQDFGNISKLDIKGKGTIDINVEGPLEETLIRLKGLTKGFEVLGYQLGEADKDISIDLKDSSVIIDKVEAQYSSTQLSGSGAINYDNSDIHLDINSQQASFHDLTEILRPIFSKLDFLPKDLDFSAKVDTSIYGKTNLNDLKIKSKVVFSDFSVYQENFSSGEFTVNMNDQLIGINDLISKKGKGFIAGNFSFNLLSEKMKLAYKWNDLYLSSFNFSKKLNLNLDGSISGSVSGSGSTKDYHLELQTDLKNARSKNYKFDNSTIKLDIYPHRIGGDLNFFSKMLTSKFDISLDKNRLSKFYMGLDVQNIKPLAVAFLGQHLETEDLSGKIKLDVDAKFSGAFNQLTLSSTLKQFSFNHPEFKVNFFSNKPNFVVNSGEIEKWDLTIKENDLLLTTKGNGKFGKNVSLIQELHFNSKIFEILVSPVLSSDGFVRSIVRVDGNSKEYNFSVTSKAKDLGISIEGMPFPLNNLTYSLDFSNKRLLINDLTAALDNGMLGIKGDVFFDDNEPDVNLKFYLYKAEIPILGKSLINLSGEGIILGNEMPYSLGGEITVNKAQVVNELSDFNSKSASLSQIRFLPKNQESPFGKMLNLNLIVKADNLMRISNSMMDIGLKGEVAILGNPSRIRAEGHLFSPINTSRIFFKNSEYFITNADLNFSPKKPISNPDFDIQAITFISSYNVNAKAYGDLDRFTFDLTSEPSLSRNSILSLIAFGYTNEIQNSLEAKDQQSLTQVGVGSFVFDQFKISDILKKQFGLQVNLGTVLEQSQTDSLISGRGQGDGQGQALGRTRSATKIELKKRLDEALTLSVSSTMGGSIGQRQSMNLNYGLNKKVQVEGVYELRTNEEGQEDVIDNSIGADLKFRWTFK
jgi:translocation and assembly module TamB